MIRRLAAAMGRSVMTRSPLREPIYAVCRRCVNWYQGENNSDEATNGERALLRRLLQGAGPVTIFDVGANVGDWTRQCLAVNPQARVHCFEPCGATFDMLRRPDLPEKSVCLNNFGLGSAAEKRILHILTAGAGSNSLYLHHEITSQRDAFPLDRNADHEEVAISTVDDYCAGRGIRSIDFLKIDVEGHELEVIRGAAGLFRSGGIGVVQFEYNVTYIEARVFLKDVFDFLGRFGFRIYKIYPDGPRLVSGYDPVLENFRYACYIARTPQAKLGGWF